MKNELKLEAVNPHAAGIDVGSKSHFVCIGQQLDQVREFGVYTQDHEQMIEWLTQAGIKTIAMESTGSYWQTLFSALQSANFEVLLVNGKEIKNVKGKKTDVMDCMWIQQLHSIGLLRSNFLPDESTRQLRTYYNHRQGLIEQCSQCTLRMQQSLRLMNIRLDVAIRDITGKTGINIIEAILAGERDASKLASLADIRVKKSQSEIAASLEGEWKEDLLFSLQQHYDLLVYLREKLTVVDSKMESLLKKELSGTFSNIANKKDLKRKKHHKNDPTFDLRSLAYQIIGVDLYQINGINNGTVLCFLSTIGTGIYKFPSAKHFVSWLRLAPNNKISGGKLLGSRTPKGRNKLSLALRQAANAVGNTKEHPLKKFFSRIAYKKGRGAAITATARKLATIIYHMVTKLQEFNPDYFFINDRIERNNKINSIRKLMDQIDLSPEERHLYFS